MTLVLGKSIFFFSCYGSVTSLNGQPESEITVQAFAVDKNIVHAEETVTGDDGEYRIKGSWTLTLQLDTYIYIYWFQGCGVFS